MIQGDIVANLTANTSQWTAALSEAISPVNLLSGAVTAFTAAAVKSFVDYGSQLDDMAQRTNVSAESLSAFAWAAKLTDTSLESLQASLLKQSKFLADAADGSKEATETLAKLGLKYSELAGLSPDQQFLRLAEAISQLEGSQHQAALAMAVFGKGAAELLPLLNSGSEGIQEMMAEAERLGLTMSNESAAAAAQLGDSWDRLVAVGSAITQQIGSQFAPLLSDLSDILAEVAAGNADWIRYIVTAAGAVGAFVLTIKALTAVTEAWAKAQAIATAFTGPGGWLKLAAGAAAATVATAYLNDSFRELNSTAEEFPASLAASSAAADVQASSFKANAAAVKSYAGELDRLQDMHTSLLVPKSQQLRAELQKMEDDWFAATAAGEDFTLTWSQMKNLQTERLLEGSGWLDSFKSVTDELRILRGEATETELALQKMAEAGAPEAEVQRLREMMAERDKLKAQREAEDDAAKTAALEEQRAANQRAADMARTRDQILSAIDPLRDFKQQAADVAEAIAGGFVSEAQGKAFLEKEQKRLLEGNSNNNAQAFAEAVDVRSEAGNRQLAELFNRRGAGNPAEQTNSLLAQTNQILRDTQKAIERNKLKTARFGQAG